MSAITYTARLAVACPGSELPQGEKESADKPGSVEDNHSSGMRVAAHL